MSEKKEIEQKSFRGHAWEMTTDNLIAYTTSPFSSTTANKQVVAIDKGSAEYGVGECDLFRSN